MPMAITTDELYEEQQKDEELQTLLNSKTALTFKKLRLDNGEKTIYCDVTDQIKNIRSNFTTEKDIRHNSSLTQAVEPQEK